MNPSPKLPPQSWLSESCLSEGCMSAGRMARTGLVQAALVGVLLFVAVLSSCGGDPLLSEDDRNLAARMSDKLPLGSPAVPVTADESDCISKRVVSEVSSERLDTDYGINTETILEGRNPWDIAFKAGDAERIAAATFDCVDWQRFLTDTLVDAGTAEDQASCIAGKVDLGLMEQQAVASYQGLDAAASVEDAVDANFNDARQACI